MQPNIDCIAKLMNQGEWIHIFPKSKAIPNSTALETRLKWYISRFTIEPKQLPIPLPIIQEFEEIKPIGKNIRPFKPLTVTVGNPIFSSLVLNKTACSKLYLCKQKSMICFLIIDYRENSPYTTASLYP